ncbi:MAG: prolyl oligopeptidase family serine peptidase [Armatimonadetes bacterium]|nr:prolyl oligopeptidase family serine peptidase [Armatimonadota bacterium]
MLFVRVSRRFLLPAIGIFSLLSCSVFAQKPTDSMPTLRECLALKLEVRGGRTPLHSDPVEAQLISGAWNLPHLGQSVAFPNGKTSVWKKLEANSGGRIQSDVLQGGYALWTVQAPEAKTLLLEADGHSMVYVNGDPRIGDVYSLGITKIPVLLRAGANHLLFLCARGGLSAKLTPVRSKAQLNPNDITLPDMRMNERKNLLAGVIVMNTTGETLTGLKLTAQGGGIAKTQADVPPLLPFGIRKVAFYVGKQHLQKPGDYPLKLTLAGDRKVLDTLETRIRLRSPEANYKVTFQSDIDGSVQYYAVNPAHPLMPNAPHPALVLSLHGAGVEAMGQADAYSTKTWATLIAATNRRPYGFDWEDWGRMDALEVLNHAQKTIPYDHQRVYLTGHSMGGHGTWQTGVHFAERFAAIAPSAGWISFITYAGGVQAQNPNPIEKIFQSAAQMSATLEYLPNLNPIGVYILHGSADDNVPPTEAQEMARQLGKFHRDFTYYEQPGAGHWWDSSPEPGADAVDWRPIFEFFSRHTLPALEAVREVNFTTGNPGISAWSKWAGIEAQTSPLTVSSVHLILDPLLRRFSGTTSNVEQLALIVTGLSAGTPLNVEIDGQKLEGLPYPDKESLLRLQRTNGVWKPLMEVNFARKSPLRSGNFKEAFKNRVLFVYGTQGTSEENRWALSKARYDAETFWYRGNGSIEVVPDTAFSAEKDPDRNVILYGNADTNGAWKTLLTNSPIQVNRSRVQIGSESYTGTNLACLFLYPRPHSDKATVGCVSGTGQEGLRLTERVPYFVSGVAFPDFTLLRSDTLTNGTLGVLATGFFDNDWRVSKGSSAFQH